MLKIFNKSTFVGTAVLIFGICVLVAGIKEFIYIHQPAVDIYETTDWTVLENGTHIRTDLDYIETFFYYRINKKTGEEAARAYLVPNLVFTDEGVYIEEYIGVMVKADEGFEPYNTAVQNSSKWWNDYTGEVEFPRPTIQVDGYLRKMKEAEYKSLVQYISYMWGVSEQEAKEYICPYMIINCDVKETKKGLLGAGIIVMLGLGTVLMGVISGLRKR